MVIAYNISILMGMAGLFYSSVWSRETVGTSRILICPSLLTNAMAGFLKIEISPSFPPPPTRPYFPCDIS